MPVRHTIEVIKQAGVLKYTHTADDGGNQGTRPGGAAVKAKSKDKVRWKSSLGNFAIIFGGTSPFESGRLVLGASKHQFTKFEDLIETANPSPTGFKYAFASLDGLQFEKEDPELEITDDGGSTLKKTKKGKKKGSRKSKGKK